MCGIKPISVLLTLKPQTTSWVSFLKPLFALLCFSFQQSGTRRQSIPIRPLKNTTSIGLSFVHSPAYSLHLVLVMSVLNTLLMFYLKLLYLTYIMFSRCKNTHSMSPLSNLWLAASSVNYNRHDVTVWEYLLTCESRFKVHLLVILQHMVAQ